jgi:hypothetical protein
MQPDHPLTIIVVGSPSPDQARPYQFVTAALCQPRDANTVWWVERTGYQLMSLPLDNIAGEAPAGGLSWITPGLNLVTRLNALPDHSIGRLVVYSHGVPGQVDLRHGWEKRGGDYGLNLGDVAQLTGHKFTPDGIIEFNSCNTGTAVKGGSVAEAFATQTDTAVQAWTGRTSYAGINRGTCQVGPSQIIKPTGWKSFKEFSKELGSRLRGRNPRWTTFAPRHPGGSP